MVAHGRMIIDADVVDASVALSSQLFYSIQIPVCFRYLPRCSGMVKITEIAEVRRTLVLKA